MLNSFLKPVRKYEMIKGILWMLIYHRKTGVDLKEDIKSYIESEKFNVINAVRDISVISKMMYERSKMYQLNFFILN